MITTPITHRRSRLLVIAGALLIAATLPIGISAQDIIVTDLAPEDTSKMLSLLKEQKDIELQLVAERRHISNIYTKDWQSRSYKDGIVEYQFSTDYRHIVPPVTGNTGSLYVNAYGTTYGTICQYLPADSNAVHPLGILEH